MSARYWVLISTDLIRSGMDWPDGLRLTGPEWLQSCGIIPPVAYPGSNWYLVEDDDANPELEGQPVELTFRAERDHAGHHRPVLSGRHVITLRLWTGADGFLTVSLMGDESLAAISRALSETDPGLVMTSMMFEAIGRLRLALNHPDLKAVARLSMASNILDELGPGLHEPGHAAPAGGPADAASQIALRLRHNPGPATAVLEQFAGEPLRVKNRHEVTRAPGDTDRLRLPLRRGDEIYDRAADLITLSGVPCARVRLVVVRQLLPGDVAAGLAGDLPFGTLCGDRLARRARAAETTADRGIASTALLVLDGQLAGYASEEVLPGFCEHVAR